MNEDRDYGTKICLEMLRAAAADPRFATATDDAVLSGEKEVFGPISKCVTNAAEGMDMNLLDQFGNMMLILFAGHDTTAHTMTWLTFEMVPYCDPAALLLIMPLIVPAHLWAISSPRHLLALGALLPSPRSPACLA